MSPQAAAWPATRLALFYAAFFLMVGVHTPFWPLWLEAKGLGPVEIGVMIAAPTWVKTLANPLFAHLADRTGARRPIMLALAAASVGGYVLFALADGFWPLLVVAALAGATLSPLVPLAENLTLLVAYARGLDYGRIRLWGSLAFIVASVGAGWLLGEHGADLVLWLIIAALGLTFAACLGLPRHLPAEGKGASIPWHRVLSPAFVLFLVAASLVQTSHAALYGFASLHWQAAGHTQGTVGWLWAESVLAEIALFAVGGVILRRVSPATLLAIGGLVGALRWTLTATTTALPALILLQPLHALSFGAAHLGAMHYIARSVPARLSATAQSLYSAVVMGLAYGVAMPAAGAAYEALGANAFHIMAAMALAGALGAMLIDRLHAAAAA